VTLREALRRLLDDLVRRANHAERRGREEDAERLERRRNLVSELLTALNRAGQRIEEAQRNRDDRRAQRDW
jgi:hypothetical protein